MEILLLAVIFVLILIILGRTSGTESAIKNVEKDIFDLRQEINQLLKELAAKKKEQTPPPTATPTVPTSKAGPVYVEPGQETGTVIKEQKADNLQPILVASPPVPVGAAFKPAEPALPKPVPVAYEQQESWFDKWLRNNPDMEKFIGENLANKIGIAILVLGIGFFVKYAIDQDWIKDIGRICIGLFCGMVLIGLAHRLRKNYHSFSSVLVGGGLTVFYFTIALAFHEYHRLSQTSAFVIMVLITIFAVLLSILYNRLELAIIATVGGFITPFLVSNGQENYIALFTYLSILNAGLIVLAYYKRWRALNFIAFVFTQSIYLSWTFTRQGTPGFDYQNTFLFGCVFYCMFLVMNVIYHVSRGSKLKGYDFIILLSVNLCFYGAGMYLMSQSDMTQYKGLFTALIGAINLVLAWAFFKKSRADKNFIYLLIAITVTYISLVAPVQLNGYYITLFWAAEMVVLLWLYQHSFINLLKTATLLVTCLLIVSMVMDWFEIYIQGDVITAKLPVLFNKGFITGVCTSTALALMFALLKKEADTYYLPGIENRNLRIAYLILAVIIFFVTGFLETKFHTEQFEALQQQVLLTPLYLQLYAVTFVLLLVIIFDALKLPFSTTIGIIVPGLVLAAYFINAGLIYRSVLLMLASGKSRINFYLVALNWLLLLALIYYTWVRLRKTMFADAGTARFFIWIGVLSVIGIFSIELKNLLVWTFYSGLHSVDYVGNLYSKAGLSIVWGVASFIIIWLGLAKKHKTLRIIALVLFGITLVKLFAYDISNIPVGGKIAAFILLGVVLLVVSFMYQRLKKLIIDDKDTK
ncbi:MAG TPA: DUF2339 domain-containing protein [Chitinophagaceae bacterium]|nr:DUF2339 domain-containing protein [Chitinophagaceae bacterium]